MKRPLELMSLPLQDLAQLIDDSGRVALAQLRHNQCRPRAVRQRGRDRKVCCGINRHL